MNINELYNKTQSENKNGSAVDNFRKEIYEKFFDVIMSSLEWASDMENGKYSEYINGAVDMVNAILEEE